LKIKSCGFTAFDDTFIDMQISFSAWQRFSFGELLKMKRNTCMMKYMEIQQGNMIYGVHAGSGWI